VRKFRLAVLILIAVLSLSAMVQAQDDVVTLTFWDNQQAESGLSEYQRAAVDLFEEVNPNIRVEVVTVPYPEYQERLLLAIQGGNAPDVSTVDQIWNSGFAVAGAIMPLEDYVAESETVAEDNFFPGAWESATYDGTLYGIPFNVDVWQFSFYNARLLDEAGIDPESLTTWEGLLEAAEALTDPDQGQYGIGVFGHRGEDTVVSMNSFIYSNGGSVIDDEGVCSLTEPEAIEALEYLLELSQYAPEGILNNSSGDMRELFLNESLAIEWWPALEQPTLLASDLDWGFVAGTAPEGMEPIGAYGGWNLVIYQDSPYQDEAWQFIEFLTSPEINLQVVDLIPANVEAAEVFLEENRVGPDVIFQHLDNARPRPLAPNYLEVASIQMDMMQAIYSGTPVEDAAANACQAIDALN
jgi:ABC-type glycerol-3-phosphate transport system substrate-binding protein